MSTEGGEMRLQGRGPHGSGMRVQGETKAGSPCENFGDKRRAAIAAPSEDELPKLLFSVPWSSAADLSWSFPLLRTHA